MVISHNRIGANMKKARLDAGLTQFQLAEKLGCSLLHYGRMERGERKASLEALARLAYTLNISPYDLLADCFPGFELPRRTQSDHLESTIHLIQSCSKETQRLMMSICWLIAADFQ